MAPDVALGALAEPLLAAAGLELWDVETTSDVVRFFVDRAGGVDLDALSEAAQIISPLLDEREDLLPRGRYQLEVSSPGLERDLRTPEHYYRYVGSTVSIKTAHPRHGTRRHRGILVAADDRGCRVVDGDCLDAAPLVLTYDEIERARTVLEWGSSTKPGKRGAPPPGRRRGTPIRRAQTAVPASGVAPSAPDPKDQSP